VGGAGDPGDKHPDGGSSSGHNQYASWQHQNRKARQRPAWDNTYSQPTPRNQPMVPKSWKRYEAELTHVPATVTTDQVYKAYTGHTKRSLMHAHVDDEEEDDEGGAWDGGEDRVGDEADAKDDGDDDDGNRDKKEYYLSPNEAKMYMHLQTVYGSDQVRMQRKDLFFQRMMDVQQAEQRQSNKERLRRQQQAEESKRRQQRQLKTIRQRFRKEQRRRFRTQYVTSRVLEYEHADRTQQYGLPQDYDSDDELDFGDKASSGRPKSDSIGSGEKASKEGSVAAHGSPAVQPVSPAHADTASHSPSTHRSNGQAETTAGKVSPKGTEASKKSKAANDSNKKDKGKESTRTKDNKDQLQNGVLNPKQNDSDRKANGTDDKAKTVPAPTKHDSVSRDKIDRPSKPVEDKQNSDVPVAPNKKSAVNNASNANDSTNHDVNKKKDGQSSAKSKGEPKSPQVVDSSKPTAAQQKTAKTESIHSDSSTKPPHTNKAGPAKMTNGVIDSSNGLPNNTAGKGQPETTKSTTGGTKTPEQKAPQTSQPASVENKTTKTEPAASERKARKGSEPAAPSSEAKAAKSVQQPVSESQTSKKTEPMTSEPKPAVKKTEHVTAKADQKSELGRKHSQPHKPQQQPAGKAVSDRQRSKSREKSHAPLTEEQQKKQLERKYGNLFNTHVGPAWDPHAKTPKMEGIDTVVLDEGKGRQFSL
jgi:hypothetical protein